MADKAELLTPIIGMGPVAEGIKSVLEAKVFSPVALVELLKQQFPGTYEQDVGVWEGYTLGQHTLMVMGQFEKYYGEREMPPGVDKNIFRLNLGLHDIGKPEAIANGGKYLQHEYTQRMVRPFLTNLGVEEKQIAIALALDSGDPIGKYLMGRVDIPKTKEAIGEMASRAGIPVEDFFQTLLIFYKVDAGSYTVNAGGLESLDDLFDFDEENSELRFAPRVQAAVDLLGFEKKQSEV